MNRFAGQVLSKDVAAAEQLHASSVYCLHQARSAFMNGKYREADMLVHDYLKCKRDLDHLFKQKEEHEKLASLIQSLELRKINITVVQNIFLKEGSFRDEK